MSTKIYQRLILLCAFVTAVLLHIAAFVWILQIDLNHPFVAILEKPSNDTEKEWGEKEEREEIQRKNEQLAALFKEFARPPLEPDTLVYDTKAVSAEYKVKGEEMVDSQLALNDSLEEDLKESPKIPDPLLKDWAPTPIEVDLTPPIHQQAHVDVLLSTHESLTKELIRATEQAYGISDALVHEQVITSPAIKAGAEEGTLLGTALYNRSGLFNEGLVESHSSTEGTLQLTADFAPFVATSLIQMNEGGVKSESLLPASNRNALRGFDASTVETLATSDDFTMKVEYAPRGDKKGYYFRLELAPKPGVVFKRIKQNFFFLLDRSHSIRARRFDLTKQAVINALSQLNEGDTFNILVFDKEIVRMSPTSLPWNAVSIQHAIDFLGKEQHGGIFATTDLYASLGDIVPKVIAENEVNTAILLSDGDTYLKSEKQRKNIATWSQHNSGRVSLFSVASGKGNNLALLDVLSVFNKGGLCYATTDKGLEKELVGLIRSIRHPIGKDIVLRIVSSHPYSSVKLYPSSALLPNLYQNIPYVVYGVVEHLNDFHIFFQGRYYDKMLDIKQLVAFDKATRVDIMQLERKIALQRAYESYSQFLKDGQPQHLQQVNQLLGPYRIPIAFQ